MNPPSVPVLHNIDAAPRTSVASVREALINQLYQPVQWVRTIEQMKADGVERLLELGPGKVLTGLNRRIDRRMPITPVLDPASVEAALQQLEE
ncbi:MAG TPA: ACP S-malonyltransferase [Piscirickettsiaceae bacterium]|nr:ACP S-malonyltransferase [Piscirickettsiaceae bacterium]